MKKTLIILSLVLVSLVSRAQMSSAIAMNDGDTQGDTLTNAATLYHSLKVKESYSSVGFQVVVSKLSGTIAGTSFIQGSLDGTNYVSISDTLALTNVTTNTDIWLEKPSSYLYYRIKTTGSGTMSGRVYGYFLGKK